MGDAFYKKIFNPNNTDDKTQLYQCIDEDIPTFAFDLANGKGAKGFFGCGWEYFIETYYPNKEKKHYYEVLRENVPIKLFVDIDAKISEELTVEDCDAVFTNVCEVVCDRVENKLLIKPQFFVLDSSRDGVYSKHVVFTVFFENIHNLKMFMDNEVFCRLNEKESNIVDKTVYTKNRCFRILYSSKRGKNRPLKMQGKDDVNYNHRDLVNTLLTLFVPEGFMIPKSLRQYFEDYTDDMRIIQVYSNSCETNSTKASDGFSMSKSYDNIPPKLKKVFWVNDWTIKSYTRRENDAGEFSYHFVVGNIMCVEKGGYHKSNNHFVNILPNGDAYIKCADSECFRKPPFKVFNVLHFLE